MLNRFQVFDSDRFFSGKKFLLLKLTPWVEPGTDKKESRILGTKVVGAIAIDDTVYSKDVKGINEGETITFKVRQPLTSFQNWEPLQTIFVATQFDSVVIWGVFPNQLSVRVPTLKEIQN